MKIKTLSDVMTSPEVADALGVHPVTVRRLIIQGKLQPTGRIGRYWIFKRSYIEEFANRYNPITGKYNDSNQDSPDS